MNYSVKRIVLLAGLLALFMHSAFAHTYLSSVYLNNQLLPEGDCVRPHPSTAFDSPIPLVTSPDMTCGWLPNAAQRSNRKCPITAGSTIGIQWHHNSNSASDDIVDPTHKGPVMVYLAKSDTGAGNVWFKIFEDGYTASDGKWGVDRMLAKRGRVDVTIPTDIAPGNYLLRGEIIALHGAYDVNGVQPYVGCVELTITSSGNANPSGVALPGYYTPTDPGMLINIYQPFSSYVIPGPAVYRSGSSSPGSSSSGSSSGAPTSAPTTRPTSPPSNPTSTPTSAPTSAPSGGNIKVQMNEGTNVWWFAVAISGGSEATSKVEFMDSRSVSSWAALPKESYGYVYSQSVQLTPPFSLRLTSGSGKQIVLQNVFTSFSSLSLIDTGKNYEGSSSTPTSAPTSAPTTRPTSAPPTTAPTTRPTTAPTTRPTDAPASGNSVKLTVHNGANAYWFAVAVSGVDASRIASVELRDSGVFSSFAFLTSTTWGYFTFDSRGTAIVAPVTIRVTDASGKSVTGTISAITPGAVVDTRASL